MITIKDENRTDIPDDFIFDEEDDFDCSFMENDYTEKFYEKKTPVPEKEPAVVSSTVEQKPRKVRQHEVKTATPVVSARIAGRKIRVNSMQAVIAIMAAAVVVCVAAICVVLKTDPQSEPEVITEIAEEPTADTAQDIAGASVGNIPAPDQIQDVIDIIAASRLNGMTRRCYLTFDDGPSAVVTGEILDILAKYNAKATFFEVGKYVDQYPEITKRVYDEGHLLANHSYSHNYNELYGSAESFVGEINACQTAIENATGAPMNFKLMRFPGGSYNSGDHAAEKQVYKENLKQLGYYFCDWNCLNGDAENGTRTQTELVQTFLDTSAQYIPEGKNIVVLMHDTDAKQTTADALELIIQYMSEQGYTFHRLDDITL
ncbi:MAG: polysaccharide deacetylase family protein [Candidatus Ornithomonoglobus sp.]